MTISHKNKILALSLVFLGALTSYFMVPWSPLSEPDSGNEALSSPTWNGISLGGYASKVSVALGEEINFHISTDQPNYEISIWREGAVRDLMTKVTGLLGTVHDCQGKYEIGCGWPVAHTLRVPETWKSGIYTVDIPTVSYGTQHIIFYVRQKNLGSTSKAIFLSSVNTYNAYTPFGGKSLYDGSSSQGKKASRVSFDRPYRGDGLGNFNPREKPFVQWAENEGLALEYGTTYDLQFVPDLLASYEVAIIAGHSEYWSWGMRKAIKKFVENGGRFINLSGNTMWWQVRYEDNGRTLVCFKGDNSDPGQRRNTATYNPWARPIYDVEYTITGVHWCSGGYFRPLQAHAPFTPETGHGGYWVQNANHWVFDGTGLRDGERLGYTTRPENVIGAESDGTSFNCSTNGQKIVGPIGNTGTPSNFEILGMSPVTSPTAPSESGLNPTHGSGTAIVGLYTLPSGGAVFSGGTTGWSQALVDPKVSRVTRNVFDHFLANDFSKEPEKSTGRKYFFYDAFNCNNLYHDGVSASYTGPKWFRGLPEHNYVRAEGDLGMLSYAKACGVSGSGLRVAIKPGMYVRLSSQVKPNWGSTEVLHTRMYLNLANLTMPEHSRFTLIRQGLDPLQQGVQPQNTGGANVVLSLLRGTNAPMIVLKVENPADTIVMDVPNNKGFLLETLIDKDQNLMRVCVDEVCSKKTTDLSQVGSINFSDILISGVDSGTHGHLCVDELAFDNAYIGDAKLE
ncbi:conserved hypothetical protein [Gammaproteobacteria bacterium]